MFPLLVEVAAAALGTQDVPANGYEALRQQS